jgi:hypothetical protein
MNQSLQFTLDQVAKQLDLSEGVVNRLAQYFNMPKSYYQAVAGQPRLMLFYAYEVDALKEIQQLLVTGRTLAEIKNMRVVEEQASIASNEQSVFLTEAQIEDLPELMEYDQSDAMKEQLADLSFQQYRQNNSPQKAPFKQLAETLTSPRSIGDETSTRVEKPLNTRAVSVQSGSGVSSTQRENRDSTEAFSPAFRGSDWMSYDLRQRAQALHRELLAESR